MFRFATTAAVVMTVLSAPAVFADVVGVVAPTTRGDVGTGFIQFDNFTQGGAPGALTVTGADVLASEGGLTGDIVQTAPIAWNFFFGSSPDNRVYVHDSAASWTISVTSASDDVNSVLLQVKESQGTGVDGNTALINGQAATTTTVYTPGGDAVTAFYWELNSTITAGNSIDISLINAPFSFYSYDSFTVDTSTAAIAAVPEPTSLALLGLGGLLIARRRRSS